MGTNNSKPAKTEADQAKLEELQVAATIVSHWRGLTLLGALQRTTNDAEEEQKKTQRDHKKLVKSQKKLNKNQRKASTTSNIIGAAIVVFALGFYVWDYSRHRIIDSSIFFAMLFSVALICIFGPNDAIPILDRCIVLADRLKEFSAGTSTTNKQATSSSSCSAG